MNMPLTDKEYHIVSERVFKRIVDALEQEDPDEIEAETIPGVVTLIFADKKKFILNRQPSVHQLWLAAGAHAWHFDYDAATQTWLSDKGQGELFAILEAALSERLGRPLKLG
jgi:CyaY protein